MNKIKLFALALVTSICGSSLFSSCNDYLEVKLDDQLTLEEVFSKRASTLLYLRHIYSYLPYEAVYLMENKPSGYRDGDGAVVSLSDESQFSWYMWVPYLNFTTGDWGPTSANFNNWPLMYMGIEQAGIFMDNVGACPQLSDQEKTEMVAECRFLRAYCYFQMFRRYGPVFIWGDQRSEQTIRPEDIDRNTVDENIDFIISEIDKALPDLPLVQENPTQFESRVTRGAAMAAKARILLYAASPLFNGCDLYKGQMMNKEGKYLFPQEEDPQKWEKAAQAAKDVIDLGLYHLYETNDEDPLTKGINSYYGVQQEYFNSEIIWGYWPRTCPYSASAGVSSVAYMNYARFCPPHIVKQGCGGYCPSLKLVDSYAMAETGRYPVLGYNDDGTPIVDPQSGYVADGFTEGWLHPIEGPKYGGVKAHNSCIGREARYYASVFANGFYWVNANTMQGSKVIVTFFNGGTSTLSAADCVKVGFTWRRFLPNSQDYQNDNWGNYFWFYFRLGEVYLNYAEACNEKPNRNAQEALTYLNKIRNRAGLNNIEDAYPEYNFLTDKEALRTMIRKERMIELAFEGHRYYDCRRWMTAQKEFVGKHWTLNLNATNYESSWERTSTLWAGSDFVFEPKHYLIPINQEQLNEMANITQNYGW